MTDSLHPTKQAIVEAAIKIFGEKGFNGTTTREISQAAGIAEGTVFRHFPNKTSILHFIVDYYVPLLGVESLEQAVNDCRDMDKQTALRHIIQNRFDTIVGGKDLMRIILTEMQYDSALRTTYIEKVYKPILRIMSGFFRTRMENGEFRDTNPEMVSYMLISIIIFSIGNQYYFNNGDESPFNVDDLTDILLNGIKGSEQHD